MKKIIVLGARGMAGHMILDYLSSLNKYDVKGISRNEIDIEEDIEKLLDMLRDEKPDVVINCIGLLVKASQENIVRAIFINSLFPHILEDIGKETNSKIIHISTDCVFDGKNGPYNEDDLPTETNWYGRTKALGEINNDKDLTLRLSIIGPELKENGTGLFAWLIGQMGIITGYKNVLWAGVTTLELAKQIDKILDMNLTGLYHLIPDFSISKYDLLKLIKEVYKKDIEIIEDLSVVSNKVLKNSRKQDYDPNIKEYKLQLEELRELKIAK